MGVGLAETQQTLVLNRPRPRPPQVDGQLKTGRDVVIGALLGAEEFGFATTVLVCLAAWMMRKCHENTRPVGVATQDPALRKCFKGKPEYIENFLRLLAGEVRELLAQLGFRSLDEAVGRTDRLRMNRAIDFYKARNLDFSKIFSRAEGAEIRWCGRKEPVETYDDAHLLPALQGLLEEAASGTGAPRKIVLNRAIRNAHRTIGARLACEFARRRGAAGLPAESVVVNFTGCAGQSFGAFLAPGVTFNLEGEANDFSAVAWRRHVIRPPRWTRFAKDNVVAGNGIAFGGTSAHLPNGRWASDSRCATAASWRWSRARHHGCEYIPWTRGCSPTGVNLPRA